MNGYPDVKHQFILTALGLFAEQGVAAVSLRLVNRALGTRNNSAVHYHFGDKEGLIDAVLQFVQDWFEQVRAEPLEALENRGEDQPVRIEEALAIWASPYLRLVREEPWGFDAIRFLARIQLEDDNYSRSVHLQRGRNALLRLKALVCAALPELPEEVVTQRLSYMVTSLLQGIATTGLSLREQGRISSEAIEAVYQIQFAFNMAGLTAPLGVSDMGRHYASLHNFNPFF